MSIQKFEAPVDLAYVIKQQKVPSAGVHYQSIYDINQVKPVIKIIFRQPSIIPSFIIADQYHFEFKGVHRILSRGGGELGGVLLSFIQNI